jgi:hypothetical protein
MLPVIGRRPLSGISQGTLTELRSRLTRPDAKP